MKTTISILILSAFLAIQSGWAAQPLSLEEAIAKALEASDALSLSRQDVRLAELQSDQTFKQRLPMLEFSGSYVYTSRVMSISNPPTNITLGPGTSFTLPGQDTRFGDHHVVDFKAQVTQPVFTGFRLRRAYQAASQVIQARKAEADRTAFYIKIQAEQNYINLQKASSVLNISRLQVETLERHLEDAQSRVREGVALPEFVSRAEYALSQVKLVFQQAQAGHELARITLIEQLKLPVETVLDLDSLQFISTDTSNKDLEFAKTHRLEFKSLQAQGAAAEERTEVQKAGYYPALAVFAAVDYGRPGIDMIANDWMLYERAGASLSWTLWDWGLRKNRVQEAQVSRRQVDDLTSQLESQVRLQSAMVWYY